MRLTPYYRAFAIAAGGAPVEIDVYGRYICIISVAPNTATLSIDDEAPNQVVSGTQIDMGDHPYRKLTFRNAGGAPINIIVLISNVKVEDMRGDAILAAIAASLVGIDATLTTIEGETANLDVALSTVATEATLATIEGETANLDVALSATDIAISTAGGTEVLTIATVSADAGADQACKGATFWTPDADIHFQLSAVADAADPLLPANMPITIAIDNTDQLNFYNAGGGDETVNIIWRN